MAGAKLFYNEKQGYSLEIPDNLVAKKPSAVDSLMEKFLLGIGLSQQEKEQTFRAEKIDVFTSSIGDSQQSSLCIMQLDSVLDMGKEFISMLRAYLPTRLREMGFMHPIIEHISEKTVKRGSAVVVELAYSVSNNKLKSLIGYIFSFNKYFVIYYTCHWHNFSDGKAIFYKGLETFNADAQKEVIWGPVKSKGLLLLLLLIVFIFLFLRTSVLRKRR